MKWVHHFLRYADGRERHTVRSIQTILLPVYHLFSFFLFSFKYMPSATMYSRLVGYNRDLTMPLSSQPPNSTQKCYFLLIDQSAQTAVYTTAIRAVVYCLSSNKLLASLCNCCPFLYKHYSLSRLGSNQFNLPVQLVG